MEEQNQEIQPAKKQGISTLVGIIIIITVALILFGGVFAYQYFFIKPQPIVQTQNQTDQTATIQKSDLIGIWQDSSVMAAGWADRYNFFLSGKYSFNNNSMNCLGREINNVGLWQVGDNKITLNIYEDTALVGGTHQAGPCIGIGDGYDGAQKVTQKFNPPTIKILTLSKCVNPEVDYYPCISIDGISYYKYTSDPTNYGGKIIGENFTEPDFQNQTAGWKTYTNTQYGFELKYPLSAEVQENPTNLEKNIKSCVEISYKTGYVFIASPGSGVCGGSMGLSPEYIAIEDTVKIGDKTYNAGGFNTSTGKPSINGGYLSVSIDGGFIITFGVDNDQNGEIKNIVYQMLSTFKFTK